MLVITAGTFHIVQRVPTKLSKCVKVTILLHTCLIRKDWDILKENVRTERNSFYSTYQPCLQRLGDFFPLFILLIMSNLTQTHIYIFM